MDLNDLMNELLERIQSEVKLAIFDKRLLTRSKVLANQKFEFDYGEDGARCRKGWVEHANVADWWPEELINLVSLIKNSAEFHRVMEHLNNILPGPQWLERSLSEFVKQVSRSLIPGEKPISRPVIQDFIKWVTEKQVSTIALAEIDGVVIQSGPIQASNGGTQILLRQTTRADIEYELTPNVSRADHIHPPSAILEVCTKGGVNEIQSIVRQSLAILRLFGVGSVDYRRIRIEGYNFAGVGVETIGKINTDFFPKLKYTIKEDCRNRLILFWAYLKNHLPSHLFDITSTTKDYLSIAYERYSEALTAKSGFERTIADSAMAFESLFLRQSTELQFRLKLSVAKILGILGHDPKEVAGVIKEAYKVRSNFVHGGFLAPNDRRKIERQYGSLTEFQRRVLDYARISIIAMTTIRGKSRNETLDLIEDSMISQFAGNELKDLLENAQPLLKESGETA